MSFSRFFRERERDIFVFYLTRPVFLPSFRRDPPPCFAEEGEEKRREGKECVIKPLLLFFCYFSLFFHTFFSSLKKTCSKFPCFLFPFFFQRAAVAVRDTTPGRSVALPSAEAVGAAVEEEAEAEAEEASPSSSSSATAATTEEAPQASPTTSGTGRSFSIPTDRAATCTGTASWPVPPGPSAARRRR